MKFKNYIFRLRQSFIAEIKKKGYFSIIFACTFWQLGFLLLMYASLIAAGGNQALTLSSKNLKGFFFVHISFFSLFVFPAFSIFSSSIVANTEHKHSTKNLLKSLPVSGFEFFTAKLLKSYILLLINILISLIVLLVYYINIQSQINTYWEIGIGEVFYLIWVAVSSSIFCLPIILIIQWLGYRFNIFIINSIGANCSQSHQRRFPYSEGKNSDCFEHSFALRHSGN